MGIGNETQAEHTAPAKSLSVRSRDHLYIFECFNIEHFSLLVQKI